MEFPASAEPEITILKFILPFAVFLMGTTGKFSSAKKIAENQKEIPIYMIICRKDAKGEAGFSRMFGEHSRRRTGATGFVAHWAAIKKSLRSLCCTGSTNVVSARMRGSDRLSGKRYYLKAF
ncbi:MAG: hypothetical protein A2W42_03280 [Candidatus Muproteobacteria bacterium RIFCSPHIGHO2_01_60_12]|nr:MAG: hypothetical protein A2W42_03280 [Candidatus Muproteobacteria bacterium RIFCSPHIGHO2_01_60_12]